VGQIFIREIFYYRHYFLEFFNELNEDVQKKFNWTLELIATLERVPKKYFQHMTGTVGLKSELKLEVTFLEPSHFLTRDN
jgi:hypothetical protein